MFERHYNEIMTPERGSTADFIISYFKLCQRHDGYYLTKFYKLLKHFMQKLTFTQYTATCDERFLFSMNQVAGLLVTKTVIDK